jgi:hypothetical protein
MGNQPIKKFRSGAIETAIWFNEREDVDGNKVGFKTVSFSRSYKKKGEEIWRSDAVNLRRNDLAKAILVLQKAQEELLLNDPKNEVEEE